METALFKLMTAIFLQC